MSRMARMIVQKSCRVGKFVEHFGETSSAIRPIEPGAMPLVMGAIDQPTDPDRVLEFGT